MNATDWTVIETTESQFQPTQLHHKETVFTLSNGYLGTRGTFEEGYPGSSPATLINGVYDDAPIVSPELVNCPDWLAFTLRVNGDRLRLDRGTVLHYQRWLDLKTGLLSRRVVWRSAAGQTLNLLFERFVSLDNPHVLGLRCRIEPIDCDPAIEIHSSINGYPDNDGLLHWNWLDQGVTPDSLWLHLQTRRSHVELGMATRLTVAADKSRVDKSETDKSGAEFETDKSEADKSEADKSGVEALQTQSVNLQNVPTLVVTFQGRSRQPVTLEKLVTVYTSREVVNPAQSAQDTLAMLPNFSMLFAAHTAAWETVWQDDIVIEGDSTAQLAVRYNLFQLFSAVSRTSDRVSIPAKMLSGFAYRGHVFWDTEIFVLPFLIFTQPALAKNLLTYRYHGLAGARRKAQAAGYEGAMYVWESADTGDETTPTWIPVPHLKDLVRIWCGDLEVHISADIAYGVYQYWQATGDRDWMLACGAEMILETAVFWGSRVEWNGQHDRYDIRDVIGPDEYHDRIDNNAFTNRLVQWHLQTALEVLDWLRQTAPDRAAELDSHLQLSDRRAYWQNIIEKIWVAHDLETGLIEQFQGFFNLEDVNLSEYEPRSQSMQVILGIEGASQRQVLKQADVIMLLYLLRRSAFVNSDRGYDLKTLQTNWDYYVPRTDHTYGSSLGPPVHAIMACELGYISEAYEHFLRSALVDLADVRGNAGEGIHAASTGGVWQSVVFGFGGICLTESGPIATPRLPAGWTRLKFHLTWQGQRYEFDLRSAQGEGAIAAELVPQPIQAVIFDLDGVLTDTSEFHYLSWKRLADECGIPFDRHANEALRGVSRRDSLLFLLQGRPVSEEQLLEMMQRKNSYYLELIKTITPDQVLPGVAELLEELAAAGVKIALGSASKNAREVVQRLGIADRLSAIADGHSVTQSKPAPDVFLHAATQLGVDPATCVVVEDAASGVEAALRAGMWVVGLGPHDRVGAAQVVLPNLVGVRWADLVESLTQRSWRRAGDLTLQCLMQSV